MWPSMPSHLKICNLDESHIHAPVVCPNGGTFHLDARRVCAWCPSICKLRIHELCQHYVRAYGLILDKVYSSILERGVVQILVFQACLMSLYLYFLAFVFLHMTEFPVEVMRFLDGHGEKFLMAVFYRLQSRIPIILHSLLPIHRSNPFTASTFHK